MRTFAAVLFAFMSTVARAEDSWSFVWVGATDQGLRIIEGKGTSKVDGREVHFDLIAKDSTKYIADAVLNGRSVEAGFAGVGVAYRGITVLKGTHSKQVASAKGGCGFEMIQLQNEYNSLSLTRPLCIKP
jgi:hypothetical protein